MHATKKFISIDDDNINVNAENLAWGLYLNPAILA